jgi:hypothetical protein
LVGFSIENSMKKYRLILFFVLAIQWLAYPNPILTKSRYLLACLENGSTGTVSLGNDLYNLVFLPDHDSEIHTDSDCWNIIPIEKGKYAIRNDFTKHYVRFQPDSSDRTALRMVDSMKSDGTTTWTLEAKTFDNKVYYMIRSLYNPSKIWNKRLKTFDGVFPVGTYEATGSTLDYFLIYDLDGEPVEDDGGLFVTPPARTQNLGFLSTYLDSLTVEDKLPAVDQTQQKLLVTISENSISSSNVWLAVRFVPRKPSYSLYIDGNPVTSGAKVKFQSFRDDQSHSLQIREGTTVVASSSMAFTCLPLVQLYSDKSLNSTYSLGRIVVTEPDKPGFSERLLANLKTRGAYSAKFEKVALSIKLKYDNGIAPIDRSFFGLRKDNNWVLDAMCIDLARMRNRVSTDLWNDFSIKPLYAEPGMINGTRGHFVEVFINDTYFGLYSMTEKVDRKQLKLKKFEPATPTSPVIQHGALYKVDGWSFESLMGNTRSSYYQAGQAIGNSSNTSESWKGYATKYPDLGDGEPIDWKTMRDAVVLCSDFTTDAVFASEAPKRFDLPQILDYYLFLEFILAADNQGKNMYFATIDQSVSPMLFITPWDLDATWGRRWNGTSSATGPNQDFDSFVDKSVQAQSNLFYRLKKLNVGGFKDNLPIRYRELRGSFFSFNSVMNRFQTYQATFMKSGALKRELARWSGTTFAPDTNFDLSFLFTWISSRIAFLDKQYLGGPYTDLAESIETPFRAFPNPTSGPCTLQGLPDDASVELYTLQGQRLGRFRSDGTTLQLDLSAYDPGLYLIKTGNKTVKVVRK